MEKKSLKKRYIGDRAFYGMILAIAVPIMVQNGISNFVSLLDNLMIGRVGTNALSGVAISNQLIFVYYLLIFGASAGVGIFTAQYFGMNDIKGVRYTFRFKLMINTILSIFSILIFFLFSDKLIELFLQGEGAVEDAEETLRLGIEYMDIMLIGLIPVGITNAFAGTLRDTGQTKAPMTASVVAIFVNLIGNALLIYGLFGLPALGAAGAAVATVISRFVEMGFIIIYTLRHAEEHQFIRGAFKDFRVPLKLVSKFILKSLPLMANETLWALGQTFLNQSYSFRSLDAVAALNIESTIWNLMGVSFLAMGEAVGIVVGQILGSGDIEKARDHARKMIAFTTLLGLAFGLLMLAVSPFFPLLYKTSDHVRHMASQFIFVCGVLMPFYAFTHASYFTIRSGGNTLITFIFDSCFVWLLSVPTAFILSRFTGLSVLYMMIIVQSLEIIKCLIGGGMVASGIWAKNIVSKN
ncbi:MAG: MATE family efflux transporter [Lachnospiraceae bacterium]|nr:MATE family efflux transporter [Lachnospiraceae bacterium]